MAEVDLEINLYDVNKQLMNTRYPLSREALISGISDIADWFSSERNRYFMLLCHEKRDYTLFRFDNGSKKCYAASQEVKEALENRGDILSIDYEDHVYSIWVKIGEDSFLYYLFPYDEGVIEI